jgi:ABC-type sugar transport system permease subunit
VTRAAAGDAYAALYLLPAFIPIALFTLWPLEETGRLSLVRWDGFGPQHFIGLDNFSSLAADSTFRTACLHSIEWMLGGAVLATLLGLGLALPLHAERGGVPALSVLFFPALLPATVVASIWLLVLSPSSGLLNAFLRAIPLNGSLLAPLGNPGQALPALFIAWLWSSVGVGTLFFWTSMRTISREFYEMALAEGANAWWRFTHVTLPALRRTAGIVMVLNTALSGGVFDLVYITTGGGPGYASLILPVDVYSRAFGGKTGQGAAGAVVQIALVLLISAAALLLLRRDEPYTTSEVEGPARARGIRLASLFAFVIALFSLVPLLWLLRAVALPGRSLALGNSGPSWAALFDNLRSAWDTGLAAALGPSIALASCVVVVTVLLTVPAGFALANMVRAHWLRVPLLIIIAIALLQPGPVLVIPLFSLLRAWHLIDNPLGIVLPEIARALPLAILAVWAALSGVARDPLEAARVDGASDWQTMVLVALPLARPALAVAAVWAFMTSWNEYLLPTVVSQNGSLTTVPTALGGFAGAYDTQFGALAAGTLISALPALGLFLVVRFYAAPLLARMGGSLR